MKRVLLIFVLIIIGCSNQPKVGEWYESIKTKERFKAENIYKGTALKEISFPYIQKFDSIHKLFEYISDSVDYYVNLSEEFFRKYQKCIKSIESAPLIKNKYGVDIPNWKFRNEAEKNKMFYLNQYNVYSVKSETFLTKARIYLEESSEILKNDYYIIISDSCLNETYIKFEGNKPILLKELESDYIKVKK